MFDRLYDVERRLGKRFKSGVVLHLLLPQTLQATRHFASGEALRMTQQQFKQRLHEHRASKK